MGWHDLHRGDPRRARDHPTAGMALYRSTGERTPGEHSSSYPCGRSGGHHVSVRHISQHAADGLAGRRQLRFPPSRGLRVPIGFDRTLDQCGFDEAPRTATTSGEPERNFQLWGALWAGLACRSRLVADTRASLSKYDVRLVIVDRAEVGSGPVMELFYAALGPPTLSSGEFSSWVGWHGWPRVEQFLPHIVPRLLRPVNDANLSRRDHA